MSIRFISRSRHPLIFISAVLFLSALFFSSCGVQNQSGLQSARENELSSEKASTAGTAVEGGDKIGDEAGVEEGSPPADPTEVKSEPVSSPSDSSVEEQSGSDTSPKFTLSEVASHSSYESCWTVINGEVYDLTKWISKHPGGASNILKLCGIDGTTAFMRKHGSSARPKSVLAGYRIGELSS